jgi:uncharacterized protein YegL
METKRTELVFILDRSGSMSGLESDTIGGFNSLLQKQKAEPGAATVTTVLFDNEYELLHDRIDIKGIDSITDKDYYVRGSTALLDAIGKTVHKIDNVQKHTGSDAKADKTLFVIITDGMENSSEEYTAEQVRALIEHQKKESNWEFLFLGANIDAIATAKKFGINADRAVDFHADKEGTQLNYDTVCDVVSQLRGQGHIDLNWKNKIDADYKKRSKR